LIGENGIMEKIWFAEYQKTGIPETVELPPEDTSLVDIFERNFQKFGPLMNLRKQAASLLPICKAWG